MKLKIPMTGKVIGCDPKTGEISGDPKDPVRLVGVDLGGVLWRLIDIDLENDLMEVEVEAPTGVQEAGTPKRLLTQSEKDTLLKNARRIVESHTAAELYTITKCARLKKAAGVLDNYRRFKGGGKDGG
jgi:hypothetical protein